MQLTIQRSERSPWTVLQLSGELDLATAPTCRQAMVLALESTALLALDVHDLDFVDSTGLGVLIGGLKRARARGGNVRLVNPNERLRALLRLTDLDLVFAPVDTLDDLPAPTGATS